MTVAFHVALLLTWYLQSNNSHLFELTFVLFSHPDPQHSVECGNFGCFVLEHPQIGHGECLVRHDDVPLKDIQCLQNIIR